jgi:hypothetical protein
MGFFDSVRDKASTLVADAERAGKVTAAQARLVSLQSDLRKAERELGRLAAPLVAAGEIAHATLRSAAARALEASAAVAAKEAEIADLRRATAAPTGDATAAGEVVVVTPEPPGAREPQATVQPNVTTEPGTAAANAAGAAVTPADTQIAPPAEKPAARKKSRAAKPAAGTAPKASTAKKTKKPATRKPRAGKPAAGKE